MKKVYIAFRYDDPSEHSNMSVDYGVSEAFYHCGATCTFAVIPKVVDGNARDCYCSTYTGLSDSKVNYLKDAISKGAIEIALHGYTHQTISGGDKPHTEFNSLSLSEQMKKITNGKALLEESLGCQVLTFVPPWNSYDINTLKALEKNKIKCLSASRYGVFNKDYLLKYIPATTELAGFNEAVNYARKQNIEGQTIVVLIHEYDFFESNDKRSRFSIKDLDNTLKGINDQDDLQLTTIDNLASLNPDNLNPFDAQKFSNNRISKLDNISSPFFGARENIPVYEPNRTASVKKIKSRLLNALLFILSILLSAYIGTYSEYALVNVFDVNGMMVMGVCLSCVVILSYFAYKKRESIFFKKTLMLTCGFSFFIGSLISASFRF